MYVVLLYTQFPRQAIGEPPLCLAATVFYAIKHAIEAARKEVGVTGYFPLHSPATCERIRMACQDRFTALVRTTFHHIHEFVQINDYIRFF